MNDAFNASLLLGSNGNDEPAISNRYDLLLNLWGVSRTSKHGLQFFRESCPRRCQCPPNALQFWTVVLVHLTVLDGAPEVFGKFPEVRQTPGSLRQIRKAFPLAGFMPSKPQSFHMRQERLD